MTIPERLANRELAAPFGVGELPSRARWSSSWRRDRRGEHRVPPDRAGPDGRRGRGTRPAHERHHVARGGPGGPGPRHPRADRDVAHQRGPVRVAAGGDGRRDRLSPRGLVVGRPHRGAQQELRRSRWRATRDRGPGTLGREGGGRRASTDVVGGDAVPARRHGEPRRCRPGPGDRCPHARGDVRRGRARDGLPAGERGRRHGRRDGSRRGRLRHRRPRRRPVDVRAGAAGRRLGVDVPRRARLGDDERGGGGRRSRCRSCAISTATSTSGTTGAAT